MKKFRNVKNTSNLSCPCGSWIQHWAIFSQTDGTAVCSEKGCGSFGEVGAHVRIEGDEFQSVFIIPLCKEHNANSGVMEAHDDVKFISADTSITCKK